MSFSKTATELHVTPAAISHQIHALEEDLGVMLFHRLNRSIELTASARVLLPGLTEAFAGIQASVGRLRAHNDTGTLTVTASPSFAAKWLVLRLHRFQEKCPEVDARISATDALVDLAKGPPLRTPADLPAHALIHDQAIERDPLAPTWSMWLKAAGVENIPSITGISFNNMHLALDATIAGHGVVLAQNTIAAADLAAGRLVRLFTLALPDPFAYYIVTAPGALERPKVRAFRDWLRCEADR